MLDANDSKLTVGDTVLYVAYTPQHKRQHAGAPSKQLARGVVEKISKKQVTVRPLVAISNYQGGRIPTGTSRRLYATQLVKIENPDWPEYIEFKREGWLDDLMYL